MKTSAKFSMRTSLTRTGAAALTAAAMGSCIAAPITLNVNQATRLTNPTGQSVNIQHIGHSIRTSYQDIPTLQNIDNLFVGGAFISFANVTRLAFVGSNQSSVQEAFVLWPGSPPEWQDDPIRVEARITAPGKLLTVDNLTGEILGFAGSESGTITGTRIPGYITGGTFSIKNLRFDLKSNTVLADGHGISSPVGTTPANAITATNIPVFSYAQITGPGKIPINAFVNRQNVKSALENAGFRVWSISADRITFSALYTFSGIKFTEDGKSLIVRSLNVLSTGKNALNALNNEQQGIGEIKASIMLSAPLPN